MKCDVCGEESDKNICSKECEDFIKDSIKAEKFNNCPHKDKDVCPDCNDIIECMNFNQEHRLKRSEALKGVEPGVIVNVDGVEYFNIKQACINCNNLGWKDSTPYCIANSTRGNKEKVKDLTKDQKDCDFWKFKESEE